MTIDIEYILLGFPQQDDFKADIQGTIDDMTSGLLHQHFRQGSKTILEPSPKMEGSRNW